MPTRRKSVLPSRGGSGKSPMVASGSLAQRSTVGRLSEGGGGRRQRHLALDLANHESRFTLPAFPSHQLPKHAQACESPSPRQMSDSTAKPSCTCARKPRFLLGAPSQLPTRHTELIASRDHPVCPRPYASISLFRCTSCGQHWQADGMQGRVRSGTSWPQLCMKVDNPQGWQRRDDRPFRAEHFPEFDNGLDPDRDCATPGCTDFPVRGLPFCNHCTLKLRAKGVAVLAT